MYGIDWEAPIKKKRGPKKGTKYKRKPGRAYKNAPPKPRGKIRAAGDSRTSTFAPAVVRDRGAAIREHHAIRSSKTVDNPNPESADYHCSLEGGRVFPRFDPYNRGWE